MNNELIKIIQAIDLVLTKKRNELLTSNMCDAIWVDKRCDGVHCSICLFGYEDNDYTSNLIKIWKQL